MMLSPHFTLAELTRSQLAARHGLDNTPPAPAVERLRLLCAHILEPVRAQFGPFAPSSGYRAPALNRLLGSSDNSQHCKGEAADFEAAATDNITLAEWCAAHLDFDQLILEFHERGQPRSGWVHCSYRANNNRRQILTIDRAGARPGLPHI